MPRQHRYALAGLDGAMVSLLLTDPSDGIPAAKASCSAGTNLGGGHFPTGTGYRTLADGIHIGGGWNAGDPLFILTWRDIAILAGHTPRHLRDGLRNCRRRLSEHQGASPTYSLKLTAAERLNLDCVVYPRWAATSRALRQEREGLLQRALGLDDPEPEDLLELLAGEDPAVR